MLSLMTLLNIFPRALQEGFLEETAKSELLIFAFNSAEGNKYQFNRVVSETFFPSFSTSIAMKASYSALTKFTFSSKTITDMVINEGISPAALTGHTLLNIFSRL